MFRYLQTGKTGTDEMIVNENPSDHVFFTQLRFLTINSFFTSHSWLLQFTNQYRLVMVFIFLLQILAQIECSPVGLPPGWIRELRYRRNSSGLRKDPVYVLSMTAAFYLPNLSFISLHRPHAHQATTSIDMDIFLKWLELSIYIYICEVFFIILI